MLKGGGTLSTMPPQIEYYLRDVGHGTHLYQNLAVNPHTGDQIPVCVRAGGSDETGLSTRAASSNTTLP